MSTKKPTASRGTTDWEAIEREFRAGIRSLREIGAEYGVTEGAIRKRAKRDGWQRVRVEIDRRHVIPLPAVKKEKPAAGFVYVIFIDAPERFYKIGMATVFNDRFSAHQCASPFDIRVACVYFTGNARAEEAELHQRFADRRVRGEWFRLSDDDLRTIAARSLIDGVN